jgi:hypothetical protein
MTIFQVGMYAIKCIFLQAPFDYDLIFHYQMVLVCYQQSIFFVDIYILFKTIIIDNYC